MSQTTIQTDPRFVNCRRLGESQRDWQRRISQSK